MEITHLGDIDKKELATLWGKIGASIKRKNNEEKVKTPNWKERNPKLIRIGDLKVVLHPKKRISPQRKEKLIQLAKIAGELMAEPPGIIYWNADNIKPDRTYNIIISRRLDKPTQ